MASGGCVEFWAKIENEREYFPDGGDPRFFDLVFEGLKDPFVLQFVSNDGCGMSGLALYAGGRSFASSPNCGCSDYGTILGNAVREWHHYAVVWDEKGISGSLDTYIAVFVDGKPIKMFGRNTPAAARQLSTNLSTKAFGLHFSRHAFKSNAGNAKSPYLIDEFKIWNFPKTDF